MHNVATAFAATVLTAVVILVAALGAPVSRAEPLPLWEVGGGATVLSMPHYLGSDQRSEYVLPFPYFIYRGTWFRADDNGMQGLLFDSARVTVDISGSGSLPVDSDNNGAREGMPDLDPTFELGPAVNIKFIDNAQHSLTARLKLRELVSVDGPSLQAEGWVFNPELRWTSEFSDTFTAGASLRSLYGSRRYHAYFYGVPGQFATPERPAYDASSGYGGTGMAAFARFTPAPGWRVYVNLSYYDLNGARYDDSPLFRQDYGVYGSVVVARILFSSKARAP